MRSHFDKLFCLAVALQLPFHPPDTVFSFSPQECLHIPNVPCGNPKVVVDRLRHSTHQPVIRARKYFHSTKKSPIRSQRARGHENSRFWLHGVSPISRSPSRGFLFFLSLSRKNHLAKSRRALSSESRKSNNLHVHEVNARSADQGLRCANPHVSLLNTVDMAATPAVWFGARVPK